MEEIDKIKEDEELGFIAAKLGKKFTGVVATTSGCIGEEVKDAMAEDQRSEKQELQMQRSKKKSYRSKKKSQEKKEGSRCG